MKKRVECTDCGHRFTVTIGGQQTKKIGVRARRVTGNQFEYTVTAPATMVDEGRLSTIADDLILSAALSLPVGAGAGLLASIVAPGYAIELIGMGASGALTLAWGWLCAEHNQRIKKVLPWFMEQKKAWATGRDETIGGNVELTMDHRYRDGHTEAGRTVQYFGELPVDVERFSQWAVAILGTRVPALTLAYTAWVPLAKGKLFSRTEYEPLLAHMVQCGVVVNQPSKGHILTNGGRRALHQHLKVHPPTPLEIVHSA